MKKINKVVSRGKMIQITLDNTNVNNEDYKKAKRDYVRLLADGASEEEAMEKSKLSTF